MRLWHKDLIPVLPRHQLLSQWRECCCIARSIALEGTPNHILVNKIMDYPIGHFIGYTFLVITEMKNRGYRCDSDRFMKWFSDCDGEEIALCRLFDGWHNDRYFTQCFYNLQEKYDCGGISREEWERIEGCITGTGM